MIASTGPRSIERGGPLAGYTTGAKMIQLQRGRAQLSAEVIPLRLAQLELQMLQRGRAQLSAEVPPTCGRSSASNSASTGPRSIERGGRREAACARRGEAGFNGAALN